MPTPPKGILLLSAGSKVAIVRIAKQSALRRGLVLHATDRRADVPARLAADAFAVLEDSDRAAWTADLLDYCERHAIGLLLPTRHGDLPHLAAARSAFAARGVALPLCDDAALDICLRKDATAAFLARIGAPAPATALAADGPPAPLPLFAKPSRGAASAGARRIDTPEQLAAVPADWILQEIAPGCEYTVNLYLDRGGEPLCAIPHRRIAVESGEVVQARVERLPSLVAEAARVAKSLPGARGILNLQAFHDPESGQLTVIEINPRIGGGFPLAHQAKGHYIEWLCAEYLDGAALRPFDRWTDGLLMMRYREALFELG